MRNNQTIPELEKLKEKRDNQEATVKVWRGVVKEHEQKLRESKRKLGQLIRERDMLRKEVRNYKPRMSARERYKRKWAAENPGKAMRTVGL